MHSQPILVIPFIGKNLELTLYGLFLSIGILSALFVYYLYTKKRKINADVQDFGFFTAIISIALGFLAAACFQSLFTFIATGEWTFGSITAMGGFVGGAGIFLFIYFVIGKHIFTGRRKGIHKKEFNKIFLTAPCCIAIAHAFGRIGCLMAGCCHGAEVSGPEAGGIFMNDAYYIPAQLYEAIFLFILFAGLTVMYFKGVNLTHAVYLIGYGVWRFVLEYFRGDFRGGLLPWLSPSQGMSLLFILGGIAIIIFYRYKKIPFMLPNDK